MTVKQAKNGKYYCRFQLNGERKHLLCKGATTQKEAEKIENGYIYKLQQQQNGVIPREEKNVSLNKILDLYNTYSEINNKDNEHKNSKILVIKEYFKGNTCANKIKRSDVESFRLFLKSQKNFKNATINKYTYVLSKAFNLAIDDNLLNYNPCRGLKKLKENNELLRYLSADEEDRLYQHLPKHIEPIVTCALQTGLRRNNILNLRWEQIDFDSMYIEIEKQENKGHKIIQIPISSKLLKTFEDIGIKESGFVFVNPDTNKPYNTIRKAFNTALKNADIKNFRFHDLRHTVGTRLIEKGIDAKTVQELLAHSSLNTTQRYVHTNSKRKREAIDVLDSYK